VKNTRLTVNNDLFSTEILMFTGPPLPIDPLRCHSSFMTARLRVLTPKIMQDPRDLCWFNTHACPEGDGQWEPMAPAMSSPRAQPQSHATLRAFVASFARRGRFRDAAAVFLFLGAALTTDGNPSLGCFAVRWWPWFSGWMRAASSSIRS
jgi:hypothetical protein